MSDYEGLYDGEPWAEFVKKHMGWKPQDTEMAGRRVAEVAAKIIAELEASIQSKACSHCGMTQVPVTYGERWQQGGE